MTSLVGWALGDLCAQVSEKNYDATKSCCAILIIFGRS